MANNETDITNQLVWQPERATISDRLESLIDQISLSTVLEALADICQAKGDHVRSNWQDTQTAKVWYATARKLERVKVEV